MTAIPDREKVIFEQTSQDFRSLNEIMWRVPVIVMTLTGGLWFGVASFEISNLARMALLALAGVANIAFILVLFRLRSVMERLLTSIRKFQGITVSESSYIVVTVFSVVLFLSAAGSFGAIIYVDTVFPKKDKSAEVAVPAKTTKAQSAQNTDASSAKTLKRTGAQDSREHGNKETR